MKRFLSIASMPGRVGTHFFNGFFSEFGIDATYEAIGAETIEQALPALNKSDVEGFSVTMPFKMKILDHLATSEPIVRTLGSCNTVKVETEGWKGYNSDYKGVLWCIQQMPPDGSVKILGDGAMSRMFQTVLAREHIGFKVFSRRLGNWGEREEPHQTLINATAVGTLDRSSPVQTAKGASRVIDLSLRRGELAHLCDLHRVRYISGLSFYKEVFLDQFYVYTGQHADPHFFDYLSRKFKP